VRITFDREYSYTFTERDPECPWIVLGSAHRAVTLDDVVSFLDWLRGIDVFIGSHERQTTAAPKTNPKNRARRTRESSRVPHRQ
jgi:hypothetical protein